MPGPEESELQSSSVLLGSGYDRRRSSSRNCKSHSSKVVFISFCIDVWSHGNVEGTIAPCEASVDDKSGTLAGWSALMKDFISEFVIM